MKCHSNTLQGLPLHANDRRSLHLFTLPQWHVFMCRAHWLVSPYPSDEGSVPVDCEGGRWLGATKAFLWLAIAVSTGLLIAGLSG